MDDSYTYDVFVSYVSADQAWVQRELLPRLAAAGLRYTISDLSAGLTPAHLEHTEILIRASRRLIAILSTDYLADPKAKFENMIAQTLDFQEMTLRVLPLIATPFEHARLPTRLAMLAIADLTDPTKRERRFGELVDVLRSRLPNMDN